MINRIYLAVYGYNAFLLENIGTRSFRDFQNNLVELLDETMPTKK